MSHLANQKMSEMNFLSTLSGIYREKKVSGAMEVRGSGANCDTTGSSGHKTSGPLLNPAQER